ncbi:hypothetical protein HanIR_Chr06g0259851 [Helianthus annuus]|nr:hypothetical protein HanIR_Chr06g0259851 [Helianthus annuus]
MIDLLMTLTKDEVVEFMDEFFISHEDFELLMIVSKFQRLKWTCLRGF